MSFQWKRKGTYYYCPSARTPVERDIPCLSQPERQKIATEPPSLTVVQN